MSVAMAIGHGGVVLLVSIMWMVFSAEAFCPVGCLCDDETLQVNCDDVNLEVIPITLNPQVQRLVLRKNKIKSVDNALRFYQELAYVDFSHNRLVDIQNKSFEAQRKLTELRLDFNKIAFISNGTWSGLRELTILSLRENYIQTLDERAFSTASKLRELDLGQNRIESIHPAAFAGLPDLRNLYLDDNRLTYASPAFSNFLAPLRPLAELNLASNDLSWIPEDLFAPLPELSALDLSGCSIRNISGQAFRGLGQLRALKLHDNLLTQVPTASWAFLTHLELLTLGQNNIVRVGAEAFAALAKLKTLELTGTAPLSVFDPAALAPNRDLQTLKVTNCKQLKELPDNMLTHLSALRRLILRDNGLESLPEQLAPWSQLQSLDLSGNPLNCQCRLKWLRDYLRMRINKNGQSMKSSTSARIKRQDDKASLSAPEILCALPALVTNKALHSLTDEQLGCRSPLSSESLVIGLASAGGIVLLMTFALLWRFRRRIRLMCTAKPHPKSTDAVDIDSHKWKPPSPTSWGHVGLAPPSNTVSLIGHSRSAPEYHKTCTNEEECFMRAVTLHNTLRPFPRTEL